MLTRSHLDSQSLGGRFDGQLDVLTPPETLRTLDDEGIETRHPVGIVTWTNEQGSRLEERDAPVGVAEGVFGIVVPCDGPWPTLALCRP